MLRKSGRVVTSASGTVTLGADDCFSETLLSKDKEMLTGCVKTPATLEGTTLLVDQLVLACDLHQGRLHYRNVKRNVPLLLTCKDT